MLIITPWVFQGVVIKLKHYIQTMSNEKRKEERPEAYPKPTKTDKQLDNQDEFIQPQTEKKLVKSRL